MRRLYSEFYIYLFRLWWIVGFDPLVSMVLNGFLYVA